LDIQKIVADLKKEREQLDRAIAALERIDSGPTTSEGRALTKQLASANTKTRARFTVEGRKRLSEAMKRSWAERRKKG
jgi:hypothetical protein